MHAQIPYDSYTPLLRHTINTRIGNPHNDCAVIALAIATATPYWDVAWRLSRVGRKANSPTHFRDSAVPVLEQLGYKLGNQHPTRTIRLLPIYYSKGTYLVRVQYGKSGHIFCLKDGLIHDYYAHTEQPTYIAIYSVEPKGATT